jgi:hypothetical protein
LDTRPQFLEFIYLHSFDRSATGLLDDEDLCRLEETLNANPHAGQVVREAGGVRKVRLPSSATGKRGGNRVLYLYVQVRQRIYVIAAYAKSQQGDITREGYHFLAKLAKNLKKES